MKIPAKKRRFSALENLLDCVHEAAEIFGEAAEIFGRWVSWQIIRGKRHICWETDRTKLSRWSQSIIETELCLRETTQQETHMKEFIQIVQASSDEAVKALLPEVIDELIALDHEYTRIERTYDTLLAGCPPGPIKRGYLWIRRDPQWYMKSWWLREDCARRGGCCGRQCGCCGKPPDPRRVKGWGHCTVKCACCQRERGCRMTERDRRRLKPDFDLMAYPWSDYSRDMFRAYIWSLE
jgi:hypothetical protein